MLSDLRVPGTIVPEYLVCLPRDTGILYDAGELEMLGLEEKNDKGSARVRAVDRLGIWFHRWNKTFLPDSEAGSEQQVNSKQKSR
jgi:hypothetical protein